MQTSVGGLYMCKKFLALLFVICIMFVMSSCSNSETDKPKETSEPAHIHDFSAATCTQPAKCLCGANYGEAWGHNYNKGVCSRCGEKDSDYIEYVVVPSFVGLSKTDAENLATSIGLEVKFITDTYSPEYEDDVITNQSSEKDVLMLKGATITLTSNNTIYRHFNFGIIDEFTTVWNMIQISPPGIAEGDPTVEHLEKGTYIITSLNAKELPSTLVIPSTYNGIKITAIQRRILGDKEVETIVFPETIKAIGGNLCGDLCNCPSLKKIIFLGQTPCYLGSFSLDENQLSGGCKIYVPDTQVEVYKNSELGEIPFKVYADLIYPISLLDETTKNSIS